MKMKGVFVALLCMGFLSMFVGSGDVGATNCYYLYYNDECSNYDWENWDHIAIAMHRDTRWESANYDVQGNWNVFGNAIYLITIGYNSVPAVPEFFKDFPLLAGVKKGQAKLLANPYESKANISQAQGFFKSFFATGCWYMKKVKTDQCPWIQE